MIGTLIGHWIVVRCLNATVKFSPWPYKFFLLFFFALNNAFFKNISPPVTNSVKIEKGLKMAYVSERISRTELGCLFAAHVSKSKYDIFDWITTGVFSAYDIIIANVHLIENLTESHSFLWFMQRNKMQLRGNNKVLLPEEGWLLSTAIQSTILECAFYPPHLHQEHLGRPSSPPWQILWQSDHFFLLQSRTPKDKM